MRLNGGQSGSQVRSWGGLAAVGQSGDVLTFCSCLKGMRAVPPNEGVQTLEGHLRSQMTGGRRLDRGRGAGRTAASWLGPSSGSDVPTTSQGLTHAPTSPWAEAKAGRGSGSGAAEPGKASAR